MNFYSSSGVISTLRSNASPVIRLYISNTLSATDSK